MSELEATAPESTPLADRWQFWIDVGGTFTDCLARRPDGTLLRRKVLSSGVTKARAHFLGYDTIIDPERMEPEKFWVGYAFRLHDSIGSVIDASQVGLSVPGRIWLASQLHAWKESLHYELVSPEEAPILAIRLFLGLRLDESIPQAEKQPDRQDRQIGRAHV